MSVHTGLLSLGEKPNKPRLKAFSVFSVAFSVLHSAAIRDDHGDLLLIFQGRYCGLLVCVVLGI